MACVVAFLLVLKGVIPTIFGSWIAAAQAESEMGASIFYAAGAPCATIADGRKAPTKETHDHTNCAYCIFGSRDGAVAMIFPGFRALFIPVLQIAPQIIDFAVRDISGRQPRLIYAWSSRAPPHI